MKRRPRKRHPPVESTRAHNSFLKRAADLAHERVLEDCRRQWAMTRDLGALLYLLIEEQPPPDDLLPALTKWLQARLHDHDQTDFAAALIGLPRRGHQSKLQTRLATQTRRTNIYVCVVAAMMAGHAGEDRFYWGLRLLERMYVDHHPRATPPGSQQRLNSIRAIYYAKRRSELSQSGYTIAHVCSLVLPQGPARPTAAAQGSPRWIFDETTESFHAARDKDRTPSAFELATTLTAVELILRKNEQYVSPRQQGATPSRISSCALIASRSI